MIKSRQSNKNDVKNHDEWLSFAEDTRKYLPEIVEHLGACWGVYSDDTYNIGHQCDKNTRSFIENLNNTDNVSDPQEVIGVASSEPTDFQDSDTSNFDLTKQTGMPIVINLICNVSSDSIVEPNDKLEIAMIWNHLDFDDSHIFNVSSGSSTPKASSRKKGHSPMKSTNFSDRNNHFDCITASPCSLELNHNENRVFNVESTRSYISSLCRVNNYSNNPTSVRILCDTKNSIMNSSRVHADSLYCDSETKDLLIFSHSYIYIQFHLHVVSHNSSPNNYVHSKRIKLELKLMSETIFSCNKTALHSPSLFKLKVFAGNTVHSGAYSEVNLGNQVANMAQLKLLTIENTNQTNILVRFNQIISDPQQQGTFQIYIIKSRIDETDPAAAGLERRNIFKSVGEKSPGWLNSPRTPNVNARAVSIDRLKLSPADMNYFLSLSCSIDFPFNVIDRQLTPQIEVEDAIENVLETQSEQRSRMNPDNLKNNNELVKFAKHIYYAVKDEFLPSSVLQLVGPDIIFDIEASQTATFLLVMKSDILYDSSDKVYPSETSSFEKYQQHHFTQLLVETKDQTSRVFQTINLISDIVRSEMSILQKNINFGRVFIGGAVSKSVTIINKSSVPCLYSISKSGSISSGFLTIPSGRRGWISAKSSLNLEFLFKPTLPGTFEEVLRIGNVLDLNNTQSIVIKARVTKPNTFRLFDQPNEDLYIAAKNCSLFEVGQELTMALDEINAKDVTSNTSATSDSGEDTTSSLKTLFIGDLMLGEASDFTISFRLKNVTPKVRQFVIDAAHIDALTLIPPTNTFSNNDTFLDENVSGWMWHMKKPDKYLFPYPISVPFETDPEVLHSIIGMHCRFEIYPVSDELGEIANISNEERIRLKDKLEHFNQKLKIATRKKRPDKIAKYEKKIQEFSNILSGGNTTTQTESVANPDLADMNSNEHVNIASKDKVASHTIVGLSDLALHLEICPEQAVLIKIKITLLPSRYYKKWNDSLPFRGSLRVFESRNQDYVRHVRFVSFVSTPSRRIRTSLPIALAIDHVVQSPGQLSPNETFTLNKSFEASKDESGVFLITISQWSSYATRHLYPNYRYYPLNILGMSIKMVQASKERVLYASFLVSSLVASSSSSLEIFVLKNAAVDLGEASAQYREAIKAYDPATHGQVMFAAHSRGFPGKPGLGIAGAFTNENKFSLNKLVCDVGMSETLEFFVCWKPPNELPKEEFIVTSVGVSMTFLAENGEQMIYSQVIPLVCFLEHNSSFRLDKYLNFGEVPLGSTKIRGITICNDSAIDNFHYLLIPNNSGNLSPIGSIYVIDGQYLTGVLQPLKSREIMLEFTATSIGKFEQEIWVNNLKDHFDCKRIAVSATVTVPSSQFIEFPDLHEVEGGKFKPIDLGMIQVSQTPSSSSYECVYKLRIHNVSNLPLVMTAVSNLRKQCFIYTDELLCNMLVSLLLPCKRIKCIFIVIRPSTGIYDEKRDRGGDWNDLKIDWIKRGRELLGGIRMIFHDLNLSDGSNENLFDLKEHTYDLSVLKKLFETTVGFRATVGSSILDVKIMQKQPLCVYMKEENEEGGGGGGGGGGGVIDDVLSTTPIDSYTSCEGEFSLENISPVFPLKYTYNAAVNDLNVHFSTTDIIQPSTIQQLTSKTLLVIFSEKSDMLNPSESKKVKYRFYSKRNTFGLTIRNIVVLNRYTGEETVITLSAYFDSKHFSHVLTDKPADNLPSIVLSSPIWLSPGTAESKSFIACGSSDKILCEWHLTNNSSRSIMVTPISDLPIVVQICMNANTDSQFKDNEWEESTTTATASKDTLFEYAFPPDAHSVVQKKKSCQVYKRETDKRSSLLSFSKTVTGALKKCGKAFSISSNGSATLRILVDCNAVLSESELKRMSTKAIIGNSSVENILDSGSALPVEGSLGLLSTEQSLKDIFQPNTSNIVNDDSHLSIEYYTNIVGMFIHPKIAVISKNIDFGTVKQGFQKDIDLLVIINTCDDFVTVQIENIPNFLFIKEQKSDDCEDSFFSVMSNSSVSPINSDSEDVDNLDNYNSTHRHQMSTSETIRLSPREKKLIEATVKVPADSLQRIDRNKSTAAQNSKYRLLKQTLYIRNMNLPLNKLIHHFRQEISMRVDMS